MSNPYKKRTHQGPAEKYVRTTASEGSGPRCDLYRLAPDPDGQSRASGRADAIVLREKGRLRVADDLREGEPGDIFILPCRMMEAPRVMRFDPWTALALIWVLFTAYRLFLLPHL